MQTSRLAVSRPALFTLPLLAALLLAAGPAPHPVWGAPPLPAAPGPAVEHDSGQNRKNSIAGKGPMLAPVIVVNGAQLNFGASAGGVVTGLQTFLITNGGGGTLDWSLSVDAAWLAVNPGAGTGSHYVTVTVDPTGLPAGPHTGNITVTDPGATNSPQTLAVDLVVFSTTTPPFGVFSTPIDGSTVRSSVPVTGWALDDIGVASVKIYGQGGAGPVYIGDAVFVDGTRPDVEAAYPGHPRNYSAGWGFMLLTYGLPGGGNGTYTLTAIATDLEGNQVTLGSTTITVDNANAVKPFGTIDTPTNGGEASGASFLVYGWALTPQPNQIPTDGSTISIYVDGVPLGSPVYNIYRTDIAVLFPGYANSGGAGFSFFLDTTAYSNGVHTIVAAATDDAGNSDGIGARYFTINNPGAPVPVELQSFTVE